ncbi:single-stranded-DNA-specific exonuclease C-terminal domain-containing protein, partial [Staphylococcus saprophyticus]|uniref:single-stranded-DNA-specific exonuclease C-terminal domain-containing protein n=1 Tax=Staphylococcus saprophyticus TaxID=29385 RepID=UPI0021B16B6A
MYFQPMPKIQTFKKSFKPFPTKKQTHLPKQPIQLSQFLNIQPTILKFILKLFLHLHFIKHQNRIIK